MALSDETRIDARRDRAAPDSPAAPPHARPPLHRLLLSPASTTLRRRRRVLQCATWSTPAGTPRGAPQASRRERGSLLTARGLIPDPRNVRALRRPVLARRHRPADGAHPGPEARIDRCVASDARDDCCDGKPQPFDPPDEVAPEPLRDPLGKR